MKNYIIVRQVVTTFGWQSSILATRENELEASRFVEGLIADMCRIDKCIAFRNLSIFDGSVTTRIGWLSNSPSIPYQMGQFLIVNLSQL